MWIMESNNPRAYRISRITMRRDPGSHLSQSSKVANVSSEHADSHAVICGIQPACSTNTSHFPLFLIFLHQSIIYHKFLSIFLSFFFCLPPFTLHYFLCIFPSSFRFRISFSTSTRGSRQWYKIN